MDFGAIFPFEYPTTCSDPTQEFMPAFFLWCSAEQADHLNLQNKNNKVLSYATHI